MAQIGNGHIMTGKYRSNLPILYVPSEHVSQVSWEVVLHSTTIDVGYYSLSYMSVTAATPSLRQRMVIMSY